MVALATGSRARLANLNKQRIDFRHLQVAESVGERLVRRAFFVEAERVVETLGQMMRNVGFARFAKIGIRLESSAYEREGRRSAGRRRSHTTVSGKLTAKSVHVTTKITRPKPLKTMIAPREVLQIAKTPINKTTNVIERSVTSNIHLQAARARQPPQNALACETNLSYSKREPKNQKQNISNCF